MSDTKITILIFIGLAVLVSGLMITADYLSKTLRLNCLLIGFGVGAAIAIVFGCAAQLSTIGSVHEIRERKGLN